MNIDFMADCSVMLATTCGWWKHSFATNA